MIEIIKTDKGREDKTRTGKTGKHRSISGSRTDFASELSSAITFEFEGSIDQLMNDLREQEKRFLDMQSAYELERYKALVKQILKAVLDEGFQTATLKKKRRDRADYLIVRDIDQRLSDMTIAVVRSNKAFDLLKTIEEIRGLLLDLAS